LASHTELPGGAAPQPRQAPAVLAGSHDPLLDWAVRESGCGLAMLTGGSLDGLRRLAAGEAVACGLHVLDSASGDYNAPALRRALGGQGAVAIEWAWRQQGLVLAAGNPLGIRTLADLPVRRARIVRRQGGAGSEILLGWLLEQAGVAAESLTFLPVPARTHLDLAAAVLEGKADAGVAVAAVARQLRLEFLPLHRERYDLAMRRRDFFEPPLQTLFAFARGDRFAQRVEELGGYDVSGLGRVVYNGP
jgi:molybdate-binding protein